MRQHQRRNTYDTERANAAATRKAQATPFVATPYEPETLAVLAMYHQLRADAYQAKRYPLPSRNDFVQRVDGKLVATEYALSLMAVTA